MGENNEGWSLVGRRKKYGRDYNINGKATTFYFQNFPTDWNEAALWRMFKRFGVVVDVYVAKKLNRLKKNFGFVRFIRIQDSLSFEKRLNGIYIGAQKIEVNVARFDRKETATRKKNPQATENSLSASKMNQNMPSRSYVEIVKGSSKKDKENNEVEGSDFPGNPIKLLSFSGSIEAMQNTLVGELENFQALMNVKAFQEVKGCPAIQFRYLGGLKMLLEFESSIEKEKFLSNGREIWQPWFKTITPWKVECNFNERIASLIIQGVPLHAWCEEAFSIIASKWGKVVIPEECNTDSPNLAFGRVGILTSHPGIVSSAITISVDGIPYKINVMEDIFESLKLILVLAANDFYQKMSWWDEDSTGENDSLNSEAPIQPEDLLESPEVAPTKVQLPGVLAASIT
uniref:RRM domain-containing protein n=1 Tax=Lactuca sativa TaxID=4236 RepID=A0A9R1VZR2_LACSA|nr:hypothetical protein LSAT_V11C400167170 [Lactuca sativa]